MNRIILIVVISFMVVYTTGQSIHIKQLSSETLNDVLRSSDVTLIDVRTPGEFANGHIAGAGQLNYYAFDFKRKLLLIRSEKPVFIDFYAPWCGPCRSMMPMIDSLKAKYREQITIVKINADASKKLVKELRIGSVPYLVLHANNKIRYTHKGFISREELTEILQNFVRL